MSGRSVRVDIRCGGCCAVLEEDEEAFAGEAIIVDYVLERHYCESTVVE